MKSVEQNKPVDQQELQVVLGRTIRELRKRRGLGQESFADAVGLHRNYVGSVERGERNMGVATLAMIAATLDITTSQLLAEAEVELEESPTQQK